MITRIQALNYKCLRSIDQQLGSFHVLVGPNGSGKSTFLDVIAFLGQLVSEGLDSAVTSRSSNFQDLVWGRQKTEFEITVEAAIPPGLRTKIIAHAYDTVRYEVSIGLDKSTQELGFMAERVLLKSRECGQNPQRELFPSPNPPPDTFLTSKSQHGTKTVINKVPGGNDNFYTETGKSYNPSFKLGRDKSALGNLPADDTSFPIANWLRKMLQDGVQPVFLEGSLLREASRPGLGTKFKPDGSNLPWVVAHLYSKHPDKFGEWILHLRTALPDLEDIRVKHREDDKHTYLMLCYEGGLEVPSWSASDGTLRMLALTLPAYLQEINGIYLIEEPENGIHPKAVDSVIQSLSSVYEAQVLLASHSPVVLGLVDPAQVLCFARDKSGATDVIEGNRHPMLQAWQGTPHFNTLFAAGVLS